MNRDIVIKERLLSKLTLQQRKEVITQQFSIIIDRIRSSIMATKYRIYYSFSCHFLRRYLCILIDYICTAHIEYNTESDFCSTSLLAQSLAGLPAKPSFRNREAAMVNFFHLHKHACVTNAAASEKSENAISVSFYC